MKPKFVFFATSYLLANAVCFCSINAMRTTSAKKLKTETTEVFSVVVENKSAYPINCFLDEKMVSISKECAAVIPLRKKNEVLIINTLSENGKVHAAYAKIIAQSGNFSFETTHNGKLTIVEKNEST